MKRSKLYFWRSSRLTSILLMVSILAIASPNHTGAAYAQGGEPTPEPEDVPLDAPIPTPTETPPVAPHPSDDTPTRKIPVTRYVATTGNNSGDCTASPCKTVKYAVNQSLNDDTIQIAAGTYNSTNVSLTAKDLTFTGAGMNETILDGGGTDRVFYLTNSNTIIQDLTIQNGSTTSYGGGIRVGGGELTIRRAKITSNTAYWGGGLYAGGNLEMEDVTVSGNSTNEPTHAGHGGGIYLDTTSSFTISLNRVTIHGNSASGEGGGIDFSGSSNYDLTNVTVSGNTSYGYGSLTAISPGPNVILLNCTITGNQCSSSGGCAAGGVYNNATFQFSNTIVSNNQSPNCAGPSSNWLTFGHNLDSGNTCHFTYTGDLVNTNPLLQPLADNGGYTQTHALAASSPAVDAGNNDYSAATDQRGIKRPLDGDGDGTATVDIGSYELYALAEFRSTGTYDGWVLEESETSETGGSIDATATTFNVGDNARDKQYRTILDFNTKPLPDNAVITSAVLKIKRQSTVGTDPFSTHGKLFVDMRKGYFGSGRALQTADFQATASKGAVKAIPNTPVNNWYKVSLPSSAFQYIHLKNVSQFRLRFQKGDNDDMSADLLKFYSGDHTKESVRPLLIIKYYVP